MEYATPAADADAPVLVARLSHIRGMLGVLQTVKQPKKQARCLARRCLHYHSTSAAAKLTLPHVLATARNACGEQPGPDGLYVRRLARRASLRALQARGTYARSPRPRRVLTHRALQVFKEYAFTPHDASSRKCFSTSLSNLVDSLSVCASSDGVADLCLKWPDQDGRLLLQYVSPCACVPWASELKRRAAGQAERGARV